MDADPNGTASDYTASVNWGDQTTSSGVVTADGNGGFTVNASHAYAEEGSYTVTVTVTVSDAGASVPVTASANVADASLSVAVTAVSATEGLSFNGKVATFSDADPGGLASDYSVTINWGDKSSSAGTVAVNPSGGFNVTGTHTYAEELTDAGGSTTQTTTKIVVN